MKKYGLLGEHLGHSFSPEIHSAFYKESGIEGEYHLYEREADKIPDLLEQMIKGELDGINVTIPYKVKIMKYLDEISPEAEKIDAVNTVSWDGDRLKGYNTDYYGFLETLNYNNINVRGKRILIMGTGGAAKAVYSVLLDQNVDKVYFATMGTTERNIKFNIRDRDDKIRYVDIRSLEDIYCIINCTPVGMYPRMDDIPLRDDEFIKVEYLVDLIYNPEETTLMEKYKLMGIKTVNGLMMLVVQALKSEEIWNNIKIKREMTDIIYNDIKKKLYK